MLADSVTALLAAHDGPGRCRRNRYQGERLDRSLWSEFASQGWLAIAVPEDCGGLGLGLRELAVVARGLGRACAPEPLCAVAMATRVLADLHGAGEPVPALATLLNDLGSGRRIAALAWQPSATCLDPADPGDLRMDAGRLTGTRVLLQPGTAEVYLVAVRGPEKMELHALDAGASGLRLRPRTLADGTQSPTLELTEVAAGHDTRLGAGACVDQALGQGLATGAVLASAELLGLCERLLDQTLEYLGQREQFGARLSSFQVLRHRLVDLYIQRELSRAALAHALGIAGDRDPGAFERAASRAKARTSSAALLIAREAVQLHGAIGYTEEGGVGVALRRIQVLAAWLGNARHHRGRYLELDTRSTEHAP